MTITGIIENLLICEPAKVQKINEEDFQRDKECLKALKQQEDAEELMLYCFDEPGFSTMPCVPYGWQPVVETRQIPCYHSKHMNMLCFLSRGTDLFSMPPNNR